MPKRPRCGSGMLSYNEKEKVSKMWFVYVVFFFYVLSVCRVLISLSDKVSVDVCNVLLGIIYG